MLLAPFTYAFHRLTGNRPTLAQIAERSWVVEAESTQRMPRASFLEETLSRISDSTPYSSVGNQTKELFEHTATHRPIVAYSLKNAAIVGNRIFSGGLSRFLDHQGGISIGDLFGNHHYKQGALATSPFGNRYFGHFWTDDVPLMLLGQQFAQPVRTSRTLTPHQKDLLELLNLDPLSTQCASFDEMIMMVDLAQGRSKAQRYQHIRKLLGQKFRQDSPPRGVFLYRGRTGIPRVLDNEESLAEILSQVGFISVRAEEMSLAELSRTIYGAKIVIGVEGSQMLHGIYNMAAGGSIVVLQPPMRFGNIIKHYTDSLGMKYGTVVGEPTSSGFTIEPTEVLQVLDMLETAEAPTR